MANTAQPAIEPATLRAKVFWSALGWFHPDDGIERLKNEKLQKKGDYSTSLRERKELKMSLNAYVSLNKENVHGNGAARHKEQSAAVALLFFLSFWFRHLVPGEEDERDN